MLLVEKSKWEKTKNDIMNLKKSTMWELQVKFYFGKNEECSLGDSTSNNSEKLLQRGSGGRSVCVILVKGEFNAIKHLKSFC